jgi:hypothetical protein
MKIINQQKNDSLLCVMANGDSIEITMCVVEGDEYTYIENIQEAADLLAQQMELQEILISLASKRLV